MPTVNPPTAYIGSTAAAILLSDGSTRVYYQGADGAIHEASGNGPAVKNPHYHDRVVVPPEIVRINSPIAADSWKDEHGDIVSVSSYIRSFEDILTLEFCYQLRVYFIDKDNFLHEYNGSSDTSQGFSKGELSNFKYKAAVNSGLLYAVASDGNNNRVGYQAANAPDRITETTWGESDPHWAQRSFS